MSNADEKLDKLKASISAVETARDADVVFYSGPIDDFGYREIVKSLRESSRRNVILVLTTSGGSADCAYRIARCIRRHYPEGRFTLYVNLECKSAGTLIAIGADEIVMDDSSELGPLDVQLSKPDELAEWTSGLTPKQALDTLSSTVFTAMEGYFLNLRFRSGLQISTKTALDTAAKLAIGVFTPIFEQIDPMRLGEIQRAMLIADDYGTRLATENLKDGTIERLIHKYPSHGFCIDRDEASELFNEVREPSYEEASLVDITEVFRDKGRNADDPVVVFLSALTNNEYDDCETKDAAHASENPEAEIPRTVGEAGEATAVATEAKAQERTPNEEGKDRVWATNPGNGEAN